MNNYYGGSWSPDARPSESLPTNVVNAFLQRVFAIMGFGLAITGFAAWVLYKLVFIEQAGTIVGLNDQFAWIVTSPVRWVLLFAPFGMVLFFGAAVRRFSYTGASVYFGVFALLMGLGLAPIFAVYTAGSIATTFFITAGMFVAMSIYGMTTKADLSRLGSILFMGLIGIIIASLVNIFLGNSTLELIISILGVIIFTGLTAYDVQNIMRASLTMDADSEEAKKASILGALSLYLDFVNLFLFLLRLFGDRR